MGKREGGKDNEEMEERIDGERRIEGRREGGKEGERMKSWRSRE